MFKLTIEVKDAAELSRISALLNGESVEETNSKPEASAKKKKKAPTAAEKKAEKAAEVAALPVEQEVSIAPGAVNLQVPQTAQPVAATPAAPMDFINQFNSAAPQNTASAPTAAQVLDSIQKAIAAASSMPQAEQGPIVQACLSSSGIPAGVKLSDVKDVNLLIAFDTALRQQLANKGIQL